MVSINTEVIMADSGDEDQWLYEDSNSNLDPDGALFKDIKPVQPEARLLAFCANPGPGSIDVLPTVKELDDKDRYRPQTFFGGPGIQAEVLVKRSKHSLKTNLEETVTEMDINVPEKVAEENNEDRQILSEDSEEDSDDDIVMVAGNFTMSSMNNYMESLSWPNKESPSTAGINLKRNNLLKLTNIPGMSSGNKHQGKFNIDDFESMDPIYSIPAHVTSIETTEEKPWLKPGADTTDYFNYGFNEYTWSAYCERQRKMRCNESLIEISTLAMHNQQVSISATNNNMISTLDDKSSTTFRTPNVPPKENTIEVMRAERKEYRCKHFSIPNFDVPPPIVQNSINSIPPPGFGLSQINVPYEPEDYPHEPDPYYNTFEPTQDMQWNQSWNSNVKSIENIPTLSNEDSYSKARPNSVRDKEYYASRVKTEPEERVYEQDCVANRYYENDRERDRERDKDRDRKHRRHKESDSVESQETSYKEEREYKHKSHRHHSESHSKKKRSKKHKSHSRSGSRCRHKKKRKKSETNKEDNNSE